MQRMPNLRFSLSLLLAVLLGLTPFTPRSTAAPQDQSQTSGRGGLDPQLDLKDADPCSLVANIPLLSPLENLCRAGGTSVGIAKGDFNGDGFADLAIGQPGATISGHTGSGDVIVLYGSANGVQTTAPHWQHWFEGAVPIIPLGTGDHFGSALASGDFNGDGFSDLAIGVPDASISTFGFRVLTLHPGAGAVVVLYGSANGLTTNGEQYFDLNRIATDGSKVGQQFWDPSAYDNAHFGQSLAWGVFVCNSILVTDCPASVGDLTIADGLVIGIPDIRGLATGAAQAGAIYMLFGGTHLDDWPTSPTSSVPMVITENNHNSSVGNLIYFAGLLGEQAGARFGAAIAAVPNTSALPGVTISDLAVGAPGRPAGPQINGACAPSCLPGVGVVDYLYPLLPFHDLDAFVIPAPGVPNAYDHFGSALAAGSLNGPFRLAIGIPGRTVAGQTNAGAIAVVSPGGALNGVPLNQITLFDESSIGGTPQVGDQFGAALAANDFNSDGHTDLAIGIPFKAVPINRNGSLIILGGAGEVDVLYGSANGLAMPAQRWNQETVLGLGAAQPGAHFGASLSAWNYGRNQAFLVQGVKTVVATADLAIGAPDMTINGLAGAGQVTVVYGSSPGGLTNANPNSFTADNIGLGAQANAHFGIAVY